MSLQTILRGIWSPAQEHKLGVWIVLSEKVTLKGPRSLGKTSIVHSTLMQIFITAY